MIITIPIDGINDFAKFVAKLNKKASKFGVAPLVTTQLAETRRMMEKEIVTVIDGDESTRKINVPVVDFCIAGEPFKLDGWSFVATVEHTPEGNLFSKAPFSLEVAIPEKYNDTDHTLCEHCGQRRKRNFTFVIHHALEGFKQVGSTCLKDFVGGHSVKAFEFVSSVVNVISTWAEDSFGKTSSYLPLSGVINASCAIIRQNGWVSVSKAEETYATPTKAFVEMFLAKPEDGVIEDEDRGRASKVIEWMKGLEKGQNEYMDKLAIIGNVGYVSPRNVGVAVSAPAAFSRAMEAEKAKEGILNEWYGEKGDKVELALELMSVRPCDTAYGTSYLYTFKDGEGRMFKWFASRDQSIQEGDTVTIKGGIKGHDDWRGQKQTMLTRCKVLDN